MRAYRPIVAYLANDGQRRGSPAIPRRPPRLRHRRERRGPARSRPSRAPRADRRFRATLVSGGGVGTARRRVVRDRRPADRRQAPPHAIRCTADPSRAQAGATPLGYRDRADSDHDRHGLHRRCRRSRPASVADRPPLRALYRPRRRDRKNARSARSRTSLYSAIVAFTTDSGRKITFAQPASSHPGLQEGEAVNVLYDPVTPSARSSTASGITGASRRSCWQSVRRSSRPGCSSPRRCGRSIGRTEPPHDARAPAAHLARQPVRRARHRSLNASTFARFPHVRMSHQRRPTPRPRSTKNHVHRPHCLTRAKSSLRSSCSKPSAAASTQRDAARASPPREPAVDRIECAAPDRLANRDGEPACRARAGRAAASGRQVRDRRVGILAKVMQRRQRVRVVLPRMAQQLRQIGRRQQPDRSAHACTAGQSTSLSASRVLPVSATVLRKSSAGWPPTKSAAPHAARLARVRVE